MIRRADGIRAARHDELPLLREIELASGAPFRDIGMTEIADAEPLSVAELEHYQRRDRALVSTGRGVPVAFLLAEPVDQYLHIAQVSVHPRAAGRRLGSGLIEHLARLAVAEGVDGLCLTTYLDVPWNAPYYRRLGFVDLPPARQRTGLRTIRELERAAGLDRWPRLVMVRPLGRRPAGRC